MPAARTVLLLTMLLTFSLHRAAAHDSPNECCYKHAEKPVQHIKYLYETPSACSLPAVVIVTPSDNEICADPKKPWVKRAVKRFQKEKMKSSSAIHHPTQPSSPPVPDGADGTRSTSPRVPWW